MKHINLVSMVAHVPIASLGILACVESAPQEETVKILTGVTTVLVKIMEPVLVCRMDTSALVQPSSLESTVAFVHIVSLVLV